MSNDIKLSDFVFTNGFIGSREIAKKMKRRHDQIAKHISKYYDDIKGDGELICQKSATGGRPVDEFFLTEPQFYHMVVLFENREKTVELKFQVVEKYMALRDAGLIKNSALDFAGLTGQSHVIEEQLKLEEEDAEQSD